LFPSPPALFWPFARRCGLHQRNIGIINKAVTGKNLLGRERTLRQNKGGRTHADESMAPHQKRIGRVSRGRQMPSEIYKRKDG